MMIDRGYFSGKDTLKGQSDKKYTNVYMCICMYTQEHVHLHNTDKEIFIVLMTFNK